MTAQTCPVMYADSSAARKLTTRATSSGRPSRPSGIWPRTRSSALSGMPVSKSLAREAIFQLDRAGHPPGDGDGVTVNAVTPGFVATDMLTGMPDKALDRVRGQIPLGRLGRPEEVARVVSFLAAEESAYITGQVWAVNGGLDM